MLFRSTEGSLHRTRSIVPKARWKEDLEAASSYLGSKCPAGCGVNDRGFIGVNAAMLPVFQSFLEAAGTAPKVRARGQDRLRQAGGRGSRQHGGAGPAPTTSRLDTSGSRLQASEGQGPCLLYVCSSRHRAWHRADTPCLLT